MSIPYREIDATRAPHPDWFMVATGTSTHQRIANRPLNILDVYFPIPLLSDLSIFDEDHRWQ
jgi:hypothetical protein